MLNSLRFHRESPASSSEMMTAQKRSGILLLIVLLVLTGSACRRKSGVIPALSPGAAASPGATGQYPAVNSAPPVIRETKFFKGSIGTRIGLQMKLTRDGENVSGNYSYQKVGMKIDLKGTLDKDGNLTLEEFDAGGKPTGLFKGSWLTDKDDGRVNLIGNWSRPNSDKRTVFSLHEEPIAFSGGVELTAKQIRENNKRLHYQVEADYPQAAGALDNRFEKFNQEAKNLVIRQVSEFKKLMVVEEPPQSNPPLAAAPSPTPVPASTLQIGYDVAHADDDLISIQFDVGSYSSGAAHPNSSSAVLNYDVKAGKALKLAELFNPGARYLQALSSYCIKELKQQSKSTSALLDEATINTGAGPQARNYQSWTITKKGLAITFDAYQVGPYAAGPQRVLVPYSALRDIIKPDGPLARFLK